MNKKYYTVVFLASLLFILSFGCSSGDRGWGDPLLDNLLDYQEYDEITFNIAGSMTCERCEDGEITAQMVKIEVFPKNDAAKDLAVRIFDGVGPFTISNLQYLAGEPIIIYCRLYTSLDLDSIGYTEKIEMTVPDKDGATIAVTINF